MNSKLNKTTSKTSLKGVKYKSILNKWGGSKGKKKALVLVNRQIDDIPLCNYEFIYKWSTNLYWHISS